jgi:hypothetical protein
MQYKLQACLIGRSAIEVINSHYQPGKLKASSFGLSAFSPQLRLKGIF